MTSLFLVTSAIYTFYGKMKKNIILASRTEKQGDIEHLLHKT